MGLDMYLMAEKRISADALPFPFSPDEDGEMYVSGWKHNADAEVADFDALCRTTGVVATDGAPSADVARDGDGYLVHTRVAYWRKANAVHAWFVRECQDGVDECQLSDPIDREKLTELRDAAQRVLDASKMTEGDVLVGKTLGEDGWVENREPGMVVADAAVAQKHLPTQGGFFFGSTEYDEWYISDLRETVEQIDAALALPDDVTFRYRSSW